MIWTANFGLVISGKYQLFHDKTCLFGLNGKLEPPEVMMWYAQIEEGTLKENAFYKISWLFHVAVQWDKGLIRQEALWAAPAIYRCGALHGFGQTSLERGRCLSELTLQLAGAAHFPFVDTGKNVALSTF